MENNITKDAIDASTAAVYSVPALLATAIFLKRTKDRYQNVKGYETRLDTIKEKEKERTGQLKTAGLVGSTVEFLGKNKLHIPAALLLSIAGAHVADAASARLFKKRQEKVDEELDALGSPKMAKEKDAGLGNVWKNMPRWGQWGTVAGGLATAKLFGNKLMQWTGAAARAIDPTPTSQLMSYGFDATLAGVGSIPVVLAYMAYRKNKGDVAKEEEEAKLRRPEARRLAERRSLARTSAVGE